MVRAGIVGLQQLYLPTMGKSAVFEFHISRAARDRYNFDQVLFSFNGNVVFPNVLAARKFADRINKTRGTEN
ncbi:MAG TPA: hypothetical protein VFM10_11945, partial [Terriglobales bacterium]|nr:hypothetical protein [Terriglobales bacterium]